MNISVITTFVVTVLGATTVALYQSFPPSPLGAVPPTEADVASVPTLDIAAPTYVVPQTSGITLPLADAKARITKKPFGIYVTRQASPVQPEKFTGYHTGTDFETTPEEKDTIVDIHAICDGELASKRTASGYGGLAVQRCSVGGEPATVLYGHLALSSISASVGDTLKRGEIIGHLGSGYSEEVDSERKHLHLGIHKGDQIVLLGYVPTEEALSDYLDPALLLP